MSTSHRLLTIVVGAEALLVGWLALAVYNTPTSSQPHNLGVAALVGAIALFLLSQSLDAAALRRLSLSWLTLRIIFPNAALVAMCALGTLPDALMAGATAARAIAGVAVIVISIVVGLLAHDAAGGQPRIAATS